MNDRRTPIRLLVVILLALVLSGLGMGLPSASPAQELPLPLPTVDVPEILPTLAPDVLPTEVVPDITDPIDNTVPPVTDDTITGSEETGAEPAAVDASGSLAITVVNCGADVSLDADAVIAGSLTLDALLQLGCVPADGVAFTVLGDADVELGNGVSADGTVAIGNLSAGATVRVLEATPEGFLALTEAQVAVVATASPLLFVNVAAEADVTADLSITKLNCGADVVLDADAVVAGTLDADALVALGCEFADDVAFTVTGDGDVELGNGLTVDGQLTIQDLELGAHVRVAETVPDGYNAVTRARYVVVAPGLNLLFVNTAVEADVRADLTITAIACGANVTLDADAVVTGALDVDALLELGCELADGVPFTVTGAADVALGDGVTVDGKLIVEDLLLGSLVTVSQETPDGLVALIDSRTVVVTPRRDLLFVTIDAEADITADLAITKINCGADVALDVDAVLLGAISAGALIDLGCELADDVAFVVTADAGAELGEGLTVDGSLLVEDLTVGATVTVTETVPDGYFALTEAQVAVVVPGIELLFVNVDAEADVTVDLTITKLICEVGAQVTAEAVVNGTVTADALIDLGCVLGDGVEFSVIGDGDVVLGRGITVDGRVTIEEILLGARVTVRESIPAGYTALSETRATVVVPGGSLLFVNFGTLPDATETAVASLTPADGTATAAASETAAAATETAEAAASETAVAAATLEEVVGGVNQPGEFTPTPDADRPAAAVRDGDREGDAVDVTSLPNTGSRGPLSQSQSDIAAVLAVLGALASAAALTLLRLRRTPGQRRSLGG